MEHTNSVDGEATDDSFTITITETDDEDATNTLDYSDPEDEQDAPESGATIEWLTYENSKLRSSIPRLKQAIKLRDDTIKSLRREAKKVTAWNSRSGDEGWCDGRLPRFKSVTSR